MRKFVKHLSYGATTPSRKNRKASSERAKTIIFDLPEYQAFMNGLKNVMLGHTSDMVISAGVATCHPDDEYVKKIGIQKAEAAMRQYVCSISSAIFNGDTVLLRLVSGQHMFVIELNHIKQAARIKLEG